MTLVANRTVLVDLKANTAQFKSAMTDAAGSMKGLDAEQAKAQKRAAMWSAVGKASTAAGIGIAAGLLATTKAASNQEQALGALNAVFKLNTQAMVDNARGATQIGLSTTQYANSAAKLGAQLGNLGVDQNQLGATTDDLIRKAADMAAQFGGPTSQAVDAISAALRGERDPIEQYGVTLTETGIKAEMAATGLDKTAATLSLLNKQLSSSGTIGAAAREFDTTAAATARMRAEFDNASADLGTALLPAMTAGAEAAAGLLHKFNALPDGAKTAATYIVGLGAAALMLGPKMAAAAKGIHSLAQAALAVANPFASANVKMSGWMAALGKAGLIAASAVAMHQLGVAINGVQWGQAVQDSNLLTQQLIAFGREGSGAVGRLGSVNNALEIMGSGAVSVGQGFARAGSLMQSGFAFAGNSAEVLNDQIDAIDAALAGMVQSGQGDQAAAIVQRLVDATVAAGGSVEDVTARLFQYNTAQEGAAAAAQNSAAASDKDAASKRAEADAVRALTRDLQTLLGINLSVSESHDALIGRQGRLRAAYEANGRALLGNSQAALANREAMRQEMRLIDGLANATRERVLATTGSEAKATAAYNRIMNSQVAGFRAAAVAAGFNRKQVDALVDSFFDLPGKKDVKVGAPGAKGAKKDVDSLKRSVDNVPDRKDVKTDGPGAKATESKMKQVAKSVFGVPDKKDVKTDAPGAQGTRGDLDNVRGAANSIPGSKNVAVTTSGAGDAVAQLNAVAAAAADEVKTVYVQVMSNVHIASGGLVPQWPGYAAGGPRRRVDGAVHGPGTSTSDSVPAMLSAGEFVMRAAAVDRYGLGFMLAVNSGRLPGFSRGGRVRRRDDLIDPATGKRYVWADQRWIEYHPAPRLPKGPDERPVWDKPDPRKGESKAEYRERVERKRRRFERKMERYQRRKAIKDERKDLIEQEKLDYKWKLRDEAAAKAQEEYNKRVEEAQQRLDDILQQKSEFQNQIYSAMASDWMGTFDFSKAAEATEALAEAQRSLADARKAAATAAPEDRAQALADVAAARKEVEEARKAAAAAAPTPQNVLKSFQDRARQAQEYSAGMQNLTSRGVSEDLLRELAAAGPEAAAPMMAALRGMTPQQIQQLNAQIQATKASGLGLAAFLGTEFYGDEEAAARRALANAQQNPPPVTVNIAAADTPIKMSLDSRDIWKGQLRLRRRSGNTYTFERA